MYIFIILYYIYIFIYINIICIYFSSDVNCPTCKQTKDASPIVVMFGDLSYMPQKVTFSKLKS